MVITKPVELQGSSTNIQVRRSTKTTDRRKAESAMPSIATAIYAEFDTALTIQQQISKPMTFHYLSDDEVQANPSLHDPFFAHRMLPPLEKPKDPSTKLSRFILVYMDYLEANQVGDVKERKTRRTRCQEFMSIVGDIHIEDIEKYHAYRYADWMAEKGLANKTIKSAISRVSVMLVRAEQMGIIKQSPFINVVLANYGRRSVPYLPFSPDEMKAIFAQPMPAQDRLALTLLATTGARLDEIALLEWSQINQEYGITFLDIRPAIRIKNEQSQRVAPIHSKVAPLFGDRGTGRIFNFTKDENGKSQNAAGKGLSGYVDNITTDPRKVLHSFRGTFKDMLKDAGVTATMVEKLQSGEVTLAEIADAINNGQVSKELNDHITGHVQKDVAGKYGLGPALLTRAAAVERLALAFLPSMDH